MKLRWRLALWSAGSTALLLLLLLIFQSLLLPDLVRDTVTDGLRAMGLEHASLKVTRATLWGAELGGVRLDAAGTATIDEVTADYGPGDLLAGSVGVITVRGARLQTSIADGVMDLGPVAKIRATGGALPFTSLHLQESEVALLWGGTSFSLPLSGAIIHRGEDVCDFKFTSATSDLAFSCQGNVDTRTWQASTDLSTQTFDIDALLGKLPSLAKLLPFTLKGSARLTLDAEHTPSGEVHVRVQSRIENAASRVQLSGTAIGGEAEAVSIDGTCHLLPGRDPVVDAKGEFVSLTLNAEEYGLRLADIQGVIPFSLNREQAPQQERGQPLRIGKVIWQDQEFPALVFDARIEDKTVFIDSSAQIQPGATFETSARVSLAGKAHPEIRINSKPIRLDLKELADQLKKLPELTRFGPTGTIGLAASRVAFREDAWHPRLAVTVEHLAVQDTEVWSIGAKGIAGQLTVDSFDAWLTGRPQTLKISEFRSGEVLLTDGVLRFRARADGALAIDEISFDWAGGRMTARDFVFDYAKGKMPIRLILERIDLGKILEFAAVGRATGGGTLFGEWHMTVQWHPKADVRFGNGLLETRPPAGWFQLKEDEDAARLLGLDKPLSGVSDAKKELMNRARKAIRDMAFDKLRIAFTEKPGGALFTRVQTSGRGPRGNDPIPVGGLTFNIRGLDQHLKLLILQTLAVRERIEKNVNRALRNVFEEEAKKPEARKADSEAMQRAMRELFGP